MILKLSLYLKTIRYLKPRQVLSRIFRLIKPQTAILKNYSYALNKPKGPWEIIALHDLKIDKRYKANFLNKTNILEFPINWNNKSFSKLWLYNLHYFDNLHSNDADPDVNLRLLNDWIKQNPFPDGNGWEPYPISIRLVNVIKYWLNGNCLEETIFDNLYTQANYLFNNLEQHILANHYLTNLKAILFAGIIFQKDDWTSFATKELLKEIDEQLNNDYMNYELSPMYHALMLVDFLDMFNLSRAYEDKFSSALSNKLKAKIPNMLNILEQMSFLDGGLSFFNDSVDGIAPKLDIISEYAENLHLKITEITPNRELIDLSDSGFFILRDGPIKVIFNSSNIEPSYQPGHSHADTLSLEASFGEERLIVNSGISTYDDNNKRIFQRSTKSHSTLEINNKNSSNVWSSFRVAERAKITSRKIEKDDGFEYCVSASHNGYSRFFNECIHSRKITLNPTSINIDDAITGKFKTAISRFYIHPNIKLYDADKDITLVGKKFRAVIKKKDLDIKIINTKYFPEFGIEIDNFCIEVRFARRLHKISFKFLEL